MTPEEKAEDLIDSFIRDGYDIVMGEKLAIRCALIAVYEIQKIKSIYHDNALYDYWEEVKKEIK